MTFIPTEDGTAAVLGICLQDVQNMMDGNEPGPCDLTSVFKLGQPLPQILQVIYSETDEANEQRIRNFIVAHGGDPDSIKPLED